VIEFRTAKGETLAISIPRAETAVIEPDCRTDCSCRSCPQIGKNQPARDMRPACCA
jgi:hypothetical protein